MFKLVVVSGPNSGTSYRISSGVSIIGRQSDNAIVLTSDRVSKKHCSINVEGTIVTVKDEGSSNGTFVNGGLIRTKPINAGDRISVGEFVLQLVEAKAPQTIPVSATRGSLVQKTSINQNSQNSQNSRSFNFSAAPRETAPKDLKEKILRFFDRSFMPLIYGLLTKNEWRIVCLGFFSIFIIGNLGLSVYPLLETNHSALIKEIKVRAQFMARQIAEQNASVLAAGAETKAEVGLADQSQGVRVAVLVDLDNRIIAPSARMNQYLTSGPEATAAVRAKESFRNGREVGFTLEDESGVVLAIEPVKVLSPALGKNIVAAMSVVSIDSSFSTPGAGELGVIYFQTLILTSLFGLVIFSILYKLTVKPFLVLNEDMDRALKGEIPQVTHEYQIEELNSLWEIINSAIQRISNKGDLGMSSIGISGGADSNSTEEFDWPIKMLGSLGKLGVVAFGADKRIIYLNQIFEEVSGIRQESALGQDMGSVARDQSLGLFTDEILGRASTGSEGVNEDYDFSGISYKVHVSAFGGAGQAPRCFLMVLERNE